jgi:predicted nucleic acid-binding protein
MPDLTRPYDACRREPIGRKRKILNLKQKKWEPVCRTDAMIAAITINNNAKLYTFNLRHFEALQDLGLELYP